MDNPFVGVFTIGQTLDRGVRLFRKIFKTSFLLFAIPFVLGMLNMKNMFSFSANPLAMFNPLYFLSAILSFWAWIVVVRYIHKVSQGETVPFNTLIRLAGWSDLLLIITAIIWYFALIIATILLIIPGIYLANIAMIGMIIVTVEKKYFIDGIGDAFKLTKGRWWKTFVINLVALIIITVPLAISMSLFMVPLMKSLPSAGFAGGTTPQVPLTSIIGMFVYMVVAAITYPLLIAINMVHYNSLKSEKENADLSQQLDALDEPATENK